MADPEIVKYIKEQKENGFSIEEIRNFLVIEGYYPAPDVDEAISEITGVKKEKEGKKNYKNVPEKDINLLKNTGDETIKEKKGSPKVKYILYLLIAVFLVLVVFKFLAYIEIFNIFDIIGFDPFTLAGNILNQLTNHINP